MSDRILAIDYGKKRVGIAWSDELKIIATPLNALDNDGLLVEKVEKLIKENGIKRVIVGIPVRMGGAKSELVKEIRNFVENLRMKVPGTDFIFFDESYTSKEAERIFIEKYGKPAVRRKDKYLIDSYSAALILQQFLDSMENRYD